MPINGNETMQPKLNASISVRLTEQEAEDFHFLARQQGLTPYSLCRKLLRLYLYQKLSSSRTT